MVTLSEPADLVFKIFGDKLMTFITPSLLTGVVTVLTAISVSCDALVRRTSAVHDSPVDTSVVVRQRLHHRRVQEVIVMIPEVRVTMSAAIVVVAVPTPVVPLVVEVR